MRTILLLLLAIVFIQGFSVVDNCGYGADKINSIAEKIYSDYCKTADCPSLCPGFYIETKEIDYGGLAYFSYSGGTACVKKIEITCGLSDFSLVMILAHEFAHALQARYLRDFASFNGWFVEATAEGLTVLYMQNYSGINWYEFSFPRAYYTEQLYYKNPFTIPLRTNKYYEYKYSGAVAWLLLKYGIRQVFSQYSYPNLTYIRESYIRFLLSPWQWPFTPNFESILVYNNTADAFTGRYVYEFRSFIHEPGELLVMANAPANATLSEYLYIALAPTSSGTLSVTVTVRPCKAVTTTTVTTTVPVTETVTSTVTETKTVTTVVPVTTTVTVPITMTITVPVTETITTTTTITVVSNATETVTTTVTLPITTTVTVPVTYTETYTITETVTTVVPTTITEVVTTTVPVTETVTTTVPITKNITYTVTETVYQYRPADTAVIVVLIILLIILSLLCIRNRGTS